jgi:hypothetical protein
MTPTKSGEAQLYELTMSSTNARTHLRAKLTKMGITGAKDLTGPRLQVMLTESQMGELIDAFDAQRLTDWHLVENATPAQGTGPLKKAPTLGEIMPRGADRTSH